MGAPGIVPTILLYSLICVCIVIITHFLFRLSAQRKCEEAFISLHRDIINRHHYTQIETDVVPLTLPHRDTERLIKLCAQPWTRWTPCGYVNIKRMREYHPSVQIHAVGFRRVGVRPSEIRAEMIRCSETVALVDAGDGISGYVLEKHEWPEDDRRDYSLFYISAKLRYKPGMAYSPDEVILNDIQRDQENQHPDNGPADEPREG